MLFFWTNTCALVSVARAELLFEGGRPYMSHGLVMASRRPRCVHLEPIFHDAHDDKGNEVPKTNIKTLAGRVQTIEKSGILCAWSVKRQRDTKGPPNSWFDAQNGDPFLMNLEASRHCSVKSHYKNMFSEALKKTTQKSFV